MPKRCIYLCILTMQLRILAPKCYCLLHNRSQQAASADSESYVTLDSHNAPVVQRLADTPEVVCERRPKRANVPKTCPMQAGSHANPRKKLLR